MEKKLRPLHALILFGIFLIFMPTVGALLQAKLGLGGVAITEFCLLSLAVLFPRALDIELKDVFCMTPPPVSRFFAALALSFGTLLLTTSIDMIQAYFLSGAAKSDQALSNLVASSSPVLAVIVVAILPAICEEMLFRGAIMSALRPLKRTWLILLLVGLFFGIGHFDPYRILTTGLLGAVFAYIGLKTGSIFLGCLMHFIINIMSVVSILAGSGESGGDLAAYPLAAVLGSAMIYLAVGILLLRLGTIMINGKKLTPKGLLPAVAVGVPLFLTGIGFTAFGTDMPPLQIAGTVLLYAAGAITVLFVGWLLLVRKKPSAPLVIAVCAAVFLSFAAGTACAVLGADPPVFSGRIELSADAPASVETVVIEEEGEYLFQLSAQSVASTLTVRLVPLAAEGEEEPKAILTLKGESLLREARMISLSPGRYTLSISLEQDGESKDREVYALAIAMMTRIGSV